MIDREDRAVFSEQLQQRRRGRPRCSAPSVVISVRLPEDVYDALCRLALQERAALPVLVRQALATRVRARAM